MDNTAAGRINLTQLCRVCLMEFKEMYSLFSFIQFDDNLKKPVYLYEMLMSVSSMKISSEDHLPTKVCTNCKQLAHTSYKFQQQCNRSQEILDSYLPNKQFIEEKPLNLDNDENMQCSRSQETLDSYLSDKHLMVEQKPLNLDIEENTQSNQNEEIKEDSRFVDNAFVKIEVDESTAEFVALENDVPSQQDLPIHQLEERHFDNSSDICCEDPEFEFMDCTSYEVAVPTKSSGIQRYEAAYQKFLKWCEEKNVSNYSEVTLLAYFTELSAKMKSSSMWPHYSMLKSLLNIKHGVDISKYSKLRAYLKKLNEGYTPKKSRVFTKEQFEKFLSEAPDDKYLGMKTILVIGIAGACRSNELVKMKIDDVEDLGSLLYVKIPDSKTNKTRSFTVVGERFINIYRNYISLRPEGISDRRLFIKYVNGKCHRTVMGIHKIASVPGAVASYLKLPNCKEYTAHCLRRTSATLRVDGGDFVTSNNNRRGEFRK